MEKLIRLRFSKTQTFLLGDLFAYYNFPRTILEGNSLPESLTDIDNVDYT